MFEADKNSVVEIYVNGERQATGTVVAEGNVITCLHVIDQRFGYKNYNEFDKKENPENLKIEVAYNGKKHLAKITRGNQHHDLCLLNVKGLQAKAIPISPLSYALKENDKVFSIGLPKGKVHSGEGTITRLDKIKSGEPSLVINNTPSEPGCSGGALLNEKGELIGIQGLNVASIPHAWIHELLSRSDKKIISRSEKPETEVDHYFAAISAADNKLQPSITPAINWILQRPESQFAATKFFSCIGYSDIIFSPGTVSNIEDYKKILKNLEEHNPKSCSKCEWMKKISDIVPYQSAYREKYLLKALENTEHKGEQAGLYFSLGNYNFYIAKKTKLAIECFEKTTSLSSGIDSLRNVSRMAYEYLANIHLIAGDKAKAHKAFMGAFEAMCSKIEDVPEYYYNGVFERTMRVIEEKDHNSDVMPLFSGDFEKQEVFRKCLNRINKILPPKPSM